MFLRVLYVNFTWNRTEDYNLLPYQCILWVLKETSRVWFWWKWKGKYVFLVTKQTCSLLSGICFPPKLIRTSHVTAWLSLETTILSCLISFLFGCSCLFTSKDGGLGQKTGPWQFYCQMNPDILTTTLPSILEKSHKISRFPLTQERRKDATN